MQTIVNLFTMRWVFMVMSVMYAEVFARPGFIPAVGVEHEQPPASCMVKWLSLSSGNSELRQAILLEEKLSILNVDESNAANVTAENLVLVVGGLQPATEFLDCVNKRSQECRTEAPCKNGARCLYSHGGNDSGEGGYSCTCVDGYSGTFCEINATLCNPNPCQNGATCRIADDTSPAVYQCICPDLYSGRHCEGRWLNERRMNQFENAVLGLGAELETMKSDARTFRRDQQSKLQTFLRTLGDELRADMMLLNTTLLSQFRQLQIEAHSLQSRVDTHISAHSFMLTTACTRSTGGESGVFIADLAGSSYTAYCDRQTDGGGWTVFQRRQDGSVNFNRTWTDYQRGFGSPSGEFWLGLDTIHQLTSQPGVDYELRVDITPTNTGVKQYEKFSRFRVAGPGDDYRLNVSGWSSPTLQGSSGMSYNNGSQFSTRDRDNDRNHQHCAVRYGGAWWHKSCGYLNLNGVYGRAYPHGLAYNYGGVNFSELRMRPAL